MAANGQKLRVAVTKTSARGKAAQSATPNLMSFSTDENSVWFNGKKYGVHVLKGFENLSADSNTGAIQSFLGDFTYDKWKEAVNAGSIVYVAMSDSTLIPTSIIADSGDLLSIMFNILTEYHFITIQYSTGSGYSIAHLAHDTFLWVSDISNTLTSSSIDKPLSAAQGKKLNDEKLAKTDVVNNLTTTDTSKALSAAQGKALNDRINELGSPYKVKGTKTNISDVLSLTNAKVGDVWNVTNEFTLGGKKYPAGTNVVCVTATSSSDHNDDNWDVLWGTVDLTPYLTKSDASNTYAKKADVISHYNIGELTALNSNPTQEQLKTALGAPSTFRNAIDAGKLILVTGCNNIQSQKSAVCIIDSGNVIVKYLHPGNNDWIVIAKCVPASSGDNWDNAQFSVRIVKPSDSAGITIE